MPAGAAHCDLTPKGVVMSETDFTLTSTAFAEGEAIPREFTCQGQNISPQLEWSGVPDGAESLVLFVDDPDAHGYVHWVVLDLPGQDGTLPRDVAHDAEWPKQGRGGWRGPCPPAGTHHYRFTLTALAEPLRLAEQPAPEIVRQALDSARIVGTTTLTGVYTRI